ncbi:glycosyltransferase family 2 protein [Fusobacterium varium]|uniref:glycosyltransferase family 2 protein n=1 Tax=Fusobacterium varium TaxID=856 RepID=UPI001F3BBD5E|nr:glycosyltransferase family 2 protein [Fusobacterium varium]MCF2674261.1 glycosyltransferase family 2 protein [Fusobacterium varium]
MLTIVIPTYNRKKILLKTLILLEKQTDKNYRIIIVDNNSDYSVYELIKKELKKETIEKIEIIKNKYNIGLKGNLAKIMTVVEDGWVWSLGDDEEILENAVETIYSEISLVEESEKNIGHIIFSVESNKKEYEERYSFQDNNFKCFSEFINYSYNRSKNYTLKNTFKDLPCIFLSINVFNTRILKSYLGKACSYSYTATAHIFPSILALIDQNIEIKISSKIILKILDLESKEKDLLENTEIWGKNFYPIMLGLAIISNLDFKNQISKEEFGKLLEMLVWFPIKMFFIEALIKGKEYKRMYEILYYTNFKYSYNKKRKYLALIYLFLLKTILKNDVVSLYFFNKVRKLKNNFIKIK